MYSLWRATASLTSVLASAAAIESVTRKVFSHRGRPATASWWMAAYGLISEEKWLGGRKEDISIDRLIPSGSSRGSRDCKNMKRNKKGEKILDINQMLVWVKKESTREVWKPASDADFCLSIAQNWPTGSMCKAI